MKRTKYDLLKKAFRKGLKPVPKLSVSKWADKYRVISEGNAEPGKWKTSRTPYLAEIMDAFTENGIHRVVIMSSSQGGKTEALMNVFGRFCHLDPCFMMLIQPTIELAEDFSKSRLSALIQDTKCLTSLFYGSRRNSKSKDSNQTILSKFFLGGRVVLAGANSPASLASRPIRILLCDEVDRFPVSAGPEGDPVSIAAKRMTTFWNYVMGLCSTPTVEGASRIEAEYLNGTQEEWQHQCPNCGEFHALNWQRFIDPASKTGKLDSPLFVCPDCGLSFDEIAMKNAPQKYVANNPDALKNGIRSFWFNSFSSPWISWRQIWQEWTEAKGDPAREQVIVNTRFGKSYKFTGEYKDENEFLQRREAYAGEVPDEVEVLTAAVDVQNNRLEFEICGWTDDNQRFGILRGIIWGFPADKSTWDNLNKVLDREYHFSDGSSLKVARTFVDSGFAARNVYEYCLENYERGRFPIKGKGGAGLPLLYKITKLNNVGIPLIILGVNDGKQEVFSALKKPPGEACSYHFPIDDPFFKKRGYDEIYFKQLISEHRVERISGGIFQTIWEPIRKGERNESLDLAVYNLAAMKSLGSNRGIKPKVASKRETARPRLVSRSANLF